MAPPGSITRRGIAAPALLGNEDFGFNVAEEIVGIELVVGHDEIRTGIDSSAPCGGQPQQHSNDGRLVDTSGSNADHVETIKPFAIEWTQEPSVPLEPPSWATKHAPKVALTPFWAPRGAKSLKFFSFVFSVR